MIVDKITVNGQDIVTIQADEGLFLTNANNDFFIPDVMWLGIGDSPNNYHEVTEEYKQSKEPFQE